MTPKILVVDDEPLNRTTLEAMLLGEGYDLQFAQDGREACALAQTGHPDLILLDVMMPEMDGFAVTRQIRRDPAIGRIPIILITALDDDRSRLEGLRAGADDFLTKPCRREELRARVRTVASLNRFRLIAEQRERFERLFELAPNAIVLVDSEGLVVAANAMAEPHQIGTSIFHRFAAASASVLRRVLLSALDGGAAEPGEVRLGLGEVERILHVRGTVVKEGDARLALLVFDDITGEVRAREALEKLNDELEDLVAARTRQLEDANGLLMSYAGFVSHDLRSPLTVVKGYLSMLQDGLVPLNAEARPFVETALGGCVTMQELIQNILQLAQDVHEGTSAPIPHDVDPTPVVRKLARGVRDLFPGSPARIQVESLPRVGVSAVLIERVFFNLLTNAVKYSAQHPEPRVEIGAIANAARPVIFVRDNGVGFDSRNADKLFLEFSRLPSGKGATGLGLGLALVAKVVRAHGGRIWSESSPGAGATFFVELPPPTADSADGEAEMALASKG
jgi:signal transduction histidine kinase